MKKWTRSDLPSLLDQALERGLERGAKVPTVLRMTEKAGYTDWVLLLSGRSERNVRGIAEGIQEVLGKAGRKPLGTDGLDEHLWALLDYDDFMVHVFYHPVRAFYDLESMWNDAPRVELDLPDEVLSHEDLRDLDPPDPMPTFRGSLSFGGFEDEFDDEDADDEDDTLEAANDPGENDAASAEGSVADDSENKNDSPLEPPSKSDSLEDELFDA